MSKPLVVEPGSDPRHERHIRLAKSIVLTLAWVVGFILIVAMAFAVYHQVTDRPVKELFFGPSKPRK